MAELVPSVDLKKADGSPLKVNFFFENGLPVKPVAKITYKIGTTKETEELAIICSFVKESDYKEKDLSILDISIFEQNELNNEVWIHFENFYIVLNLEKSLLLLFTDKNSYFQMLDVNNQILKSLYNNIWRKK